MIKESIIKKVGKRGTYINEFGGIGLGYKYNNVIYKTGCNGFYYPVKVKKFVADNGRTYIHRIKIMGDLK